MKVDLKSVNEVDKTLQGFNKNRGSWDFDVNMEFTRNARCVSECHLKDLHQAVAYPAVVSRYTVRIVLNVV